jgi:SM-20-related protein
MFETTHLRPHLDELAEKMWTLISFDIDTSADLLQCAKSRLEQHQFRDAGLALNQKVRSEIRNDRIYWLDAAQTDLKSVEKKILAQLESLRHELKQDLRVGLDEVECHYAYYEKGHYYQKHRDTTAHDNKRVFSFVLYLNPDWKNQDGGELVGYEEGHSIFNVKPELGRMILFRSDLEHEVKSTNRGRYSLTGWFRKS